MSKQSTLLLFCWTFQFIFECFWLKFLHVSHLISFYKKKKKINYLKQCRNSMITITKQLQSSMPYIVPDPPPTLNLLLRICYWTVTGVSKVNIKKKIETGHIQHIASQHNLKHAKCLIWIFKCIANHCKASIKGFEQTLDWEQLE